MNQLKNGYFNEKLGLIIENNNCDNLLFIFKLYIINVVNYVLIDLYLTNNIINFP